MSEKMAQSAYHAAALGCSPLDPQALGMLGLGGHGAGNSAAAAAAAAAYQRHLLSGGLALPLASIAHLGRGQERLLRQQAAGMDLCNPRWASFRRTTLYGDEPLSVIFARLCSTVSVLVRGIQREKFSAIFSGNLVSHNVPVLRDHGM